jgi:hypothetical protein
MNQKKKHGTEIPGAIEYQQQIARTLSIVQQLAQGKRLRLLNGQRIGMGEDMSIGIILTKADGVEHIGGLSTMDLCHLNWLLNENNIGMAIPD